MKCGNICCWLMQHCVEKHIVFLFLFLLLQLNCVVTAKFMKAKLYLARHAETVANRANILVRNFFDCFLDPFLSLFVCILQQGHCDYPLTEEGEAHSKALGELLRDKAWSRVFSSDLQRALSSSHNILSKSTTVNEDHIIKSELLREVNFGVREGLPRGTTVLEALEIKAAQLGVLVDEVINTAETPEQISSRQQEFLRFLYNDLTSSCFEDAEPLVLCISHGAFIKRFLNEFCNISIEKITNCSVSIVRVEWKSADDFVCIADHNEVNIGYESTYIP